MYSTKIHNQAKNSKNSLDSWRYYAEMTKKVQKQGGIVNQSIINQSIIDPINIIFSLLYMSLHMPNIKTILWTVFEILVLMCQLLTDHRPQTTDAFRRHKLSLSYAQS